MGRFGILRLQDANNSSGGASHVRSEHGGAKDSISSRRRHAPAPVPPNLLAMFAPPANTLPVATDDGGIDGDLVAEAGDDELGSPVCIPVCRVPYL